MFGDHTVCSLSFIAISVLNFRHRVSQRLFDPARNPPPACLLPLPLIRSQRNAFIPGATATAEEPIMVHFNYHPDKHVRMLCIMDRYMKGNVSACDHLPPGSKPV